MHNDKLTAGGTPRTDGLPADMPLGTVYLLKFSGGDIEYEFVSAESYRQLELENKRLAEALQKVDAERDALLAANETQQSALRIIMEPFVGD